MLCKKMLRATTILLFFAVVLCNCNMLSAQDTIHVRSDYNARIIKNNPEKAANLHIGLSPAYIDANNSNIALGFGAEAAFLWNNRLNLSARYQHAYLDRIEEDKLDNAPGLASTGSMPSRNAEFGAIYYFKKDTSAIPESIFISRRKLAGDNIDISINVQAKRLRLWGLRSGFIAYKSFIRDNEGAIEFKGYIVDDPTQQIINFHGAYSTMMETNTIYAGISRLDISDLLLQIEGHGQRTKQRRAELYADIMYAPEIVYYNMSARGTANSIGFQEYNINTFTPRSRFGARFGFTRWSLQPLGVGFGAEVGVRPGPPAGAVYNTYINLRASVNLSKHI